MSLRPVRILLIAILAEILAVLALVVIVALFGPSDSAAAQAYAERIGTWVGPVAGFLFTLAGAWWVARNLPKSRLLNGFALGVVVAIIDISILVLSGAQFQPILAISNAGRVVAGSLGGWLANQYGENAA